MWQSKLGKRKVNDMDLQRWVKDVLGRFPTTTNQAKSDEWYGVENGVDVLEIAMAVKQLQADHKKQLDNARDVLYGLITVEQLQAENKKLKGTCMCMDCGKIIKTVEQSKHSKECKIKSKP